MNIFEILFYQPIYNLIIIFYNALGQNLGLAIIMIGVVARLLMIPLTQRQMKMAESGKEMQAKIKDLKEKYKKNPEKLKEETLKVQQEYLPAQLSGCLPLIFQLILFINIYNVIQNLITISGQAVDSVTSGFNQFAYSFVPQFQGVYNIDSTFLGAIDLKQAASNIGFDNPSIIVYLLLVILVAVTNWGSIKATTTMGSSNKDTEVVKEAPKKKKKSNNEPENFGEIMQQSTKQAMFLMPILFAFISYGLPSGLALYLITTNIFVILQKFISDRLQKQQIKAE